jgi:hypothetical protein
MVNVTLKEFGTGYTLFPFRFVPRTCSGDVLGEPIKGAVTLTWNLKAALTELITAILLVERRSEYEIRELGQDCPGVQPEQ